MCGYGKGADLFEHVVLNECFVGGISNSSYSNSIRCIRWIARCCSVMAEVPIFSSEQCFVGSISNSSYSDSIRCIRWIARCCSVMVEVPIFSSEQCFVGSIANSSYSDSIRCIRWIARCGVMRGYGKSADLFRHVLFSALSAGLPTTTVFVVSDG